MVKNQKRTARRVAPSKRPSKLKPMGSSNAFRDYVLDQLGGLRGLRAQSMFGGIGIYANDDVFFALIAADTLYMKVDDSNRGDYECEGSIAFKPYDDKPMTMPYYNVPAGVLENAETLTLWARRSLAIATASRVGKKQRKK